MFARDAALVILSIAVCIILAIGSAAHEVGRPGAWRYLATGVAVTLLMTFALGVR